MAAGVSSSSCPKLSTIPHGKIRGSFVPGAYIKYICDSGYKLSGSAYRKCLKGGSGTYWTGKAPKCISKTEEAMNE